MDGNYATLRDLVWTRADTVIWLNFTLPVIMGRLVRRTFGRIFRREELWHGNRESLRSALLSRDSILLWALTTYKTRRKEFPSLFANPQYAHISFVELRTPAAVREWLSRLAPSTSDYQQPPARAGTGNPLSGHSHSV